MKWLRFVGTACLLVSIVCGCNESDELLSDSNEIISVNIPNIEFRQKYSGDSIFLYVPKFTDISVLEVCFTVSDHAEINPESGEKLDYSMPIRYGVTSQSGQVRNYIVSVIAEELDSVKEIVSFTFPNKTYKARETAKGFHFDFYEDTSLSGLVPYIELPENVRIEPASGTAVDLSVPVEYRVIAEDGSFNTFTVSATNMLSTACELSGFTFDTEMQKVEQEGNEITVYVPADIDITCMQAVVEISPNATLIPDLVSQPTDYTSPVVCEVKSSDGTQAHYTIHVVKSRWKQLLKNSEAPFFKVDGHRSIVFNGYLWILGGWRGNNQDIVPNGDVWTSQVWRTTDGVNWENMGEAPWDGRHGFGCVVYHDKIWVIGGDDHHDVWNTSDGRNWVQVSNMVPWGERYFPYITVFNDKIWVIGGQNLNGFTYYAEKYEDIWSSSNGVNWKRETEFVPFASRGLISGSIVFNNNMYLIGGGLLGNTSLRPMEYNDVWYTADGINWDILLKEAPFKPVYWHSVGVHNEKMYVIGGMYRGDIHSNEVWYSDDGVNWEQQKYNFWLPRHAQTLTSFNGKLYMIGGTVDPLRARNTQNDVWVMDGNF